MSAQSAAMSGMIIETFLDAVSVKATSPIAFIAHALAIVASVALQRGSTVEELRHSLPRVDLPSGEPSTRSGEPADPLGKLLELVD